MEDIRKELLSKVTAKPRLDADPRDFLHQARRSGFQLGALGATVDVWKAMLRDPDCFVYLGVAGAIVPAGFGPFLGELVRNRMVDVIYSTGAQVYHDLYEAFRGDHFKLSRDVPDGDLGRMNIDRIYDVVADDTAYQSFDEFLAGKILVMPPSASYTTAGFFETLVKSMRGDVRRDDGMMVSAVDAEVPVFVPTFHDSSVAFALIYRRKKDGKTAVNIDYTEDLYRQYLLFKRAKVSGAVFLGGGVPKNHIQQLHPLLQVVEEIYGHQDEGHGYGIQFTADSPVWGGLSGCTLEESESWGKYCHHSPRAVCYGDVTINFYLAACAVYHEMRDELKNREARRLMRYVGKDD